MVLIVQNTAAHRDLGAATLSVNFARQVGSSVGVALVGALFIHRLDGQLAARLPASGADHLSPAQVSAVTPQGLAHLAVPLRHVIASAFATALPPIYAYLIPLLAAAFLLALTLKEIPLHTRADQDAADAPDAAQAAPPPARARPQSARQGAAATTPGTPRQGAGSTTGHGRAERARRPRAGGRPRGCPHSSAGDPAWRVNRASLLSVLVV